MNRKLRKNQAKQRKQLEKKRARSQAGSHYVEVQEPYADMPLEEFTELVKTFAEKAGETFESSVAGLQHILVAHDPLIMLAGLSYYFLTDYKGREKMLGEHLEVLQSHAELLQSMILHEGADRFSVNLDLPDYRRIAQLLQNAMTSFAFKRFVEIDASMSDEVKNLLLVKEMARNQTMMIRNWAYPHQIITITRDLFSGVDKGIKNLYGITVDGLLTMLERAIDEIYFRLNRHRKALVPVARATDLRTAVEEYYKAFPQLKDSPEDLIETLKSTTGSLEEAKIVIIRHSNLSLPVIYTLSAKELISLYPESVREESIEKVLKQVSLGFGDLEDTDVEHLFLGNPVWSKPIIDIGNREYFFPIPGLLFSFCIDIFRGLIEEDAQLLKTYEDRRAEYLEQKVRELFEKAIPDAQIFFGSQWTADGSDETYENDILVQLDSQIILIEAKSGRVTPPAKRGAELRLSGTIQKLVIDPSKQSSAFEDYLLAHPGIHEFTTKRGVTNRVDTRNTKEVIRLSVTLDPFNLIGITWPVMQRAGLIPVDVKLTPTICLPDLEAILEILESPFEILHYLTRRGEIESHTPYVGEELDLLGYYCDNNFNMGEMEFGDSLVMMEHMSKVIDECFPGMGQLDETKKPSRKRSRWWKDILKAIEQRRPERWTELGVMLLNVPHESQRELEKDFERIQRSVIYERKENQHDHLQLVVGPERRKTVLVAVAYKDMEREERNRMLKNYAAEAMQDHGTDLATVIAINTKTKDYPYSVIALCGRQEE